MKNNRVGVWLFLLVLVAAGVASTGNFSERINLWLGKQAEPVMAEGETAADAEKPAAADTAEGTEAAATKEAAAPSGEEMAETPSGDEAAEAAGEPEAETGEQAAAPEASADEDAAVAPDAATAEEAQAEATPGSAAPGDEAAAQADTQADVQADVIVPSFGLLRVEPDGSTLIAGSAGPNAGIEILTRSETIAATKAEANGDFVAVLDDPLKPGDYEIVLRATEENGDVAMSEETAIVSVPEPGREGDLLALVERPGAPSRLINTPKPEEGEAAEAPGEDMAEAETPAGETETAMAEPDAGEPAQEDSGTMDAGTAVEVTEAAASEEQPSAAEAETAASATAEGSAPEDVTEVAEASGEAAAETPAPSSETAKITIRIEAVEIDSDTIFVAGAADPGAQVRVYANEFLLGDTVTSPGGRFLVQVRKDLAVGDYIIRADVIDPATAEVVARAAVPFTRSEGERVAAVADNASTVEQPAAAPEATEPAGSAPEQAEAEAPAAEPSSDQAQNGTMAETEPKPESMPEAEASTAMAEAPAASGETEAGETPAGETDMAKAEQPAATGTGETASGEASTEPAMTEKPDSGEMATAETETPSSAEPAEEMAEASGTASESEEMSSTETPAAGEGEEQVASASESSAPPEVSEDITVTGKLRQTNSSVIIRRGDTLWHISRRVYGQGTRYTTIYLANQDQIKDPDMIWPGQIFELPDEAKPEN